MTLDLFFELLASLFTIAQFWYYGNISKWGPIAGLIAAAAWWVLTFYSGLWGLVPLNAVATVLHIRNLYKWRKEGLI
jgi:nicotinamide riboside transporter PnuC